MTAQISTAPARPRILVVEDEVLICLLIETILSDAGYDVLIANNLPDAFRCIEQGGIDAALLDLNIKGEKVYPVAEKLAQTATPFVFASGGGFADMGSFRDNPMVGKPFQEDELLRAIAHMVQPR